MAGKASRQRGLTFLELMIVVALLSLMAVIAVPAYQNHVERAQAAQALADIGAICLDIDRYRLSNEDMLPPSLATIGRDDLRDPWGNPYSYLVIAGADLTDVRKDRNLVPINTDFDLYSNGRNGQTRPPLTAAPSRDDIVRANNGNFLGRAEDY